MSGSNWDDLKARVGSGVVMIVIAGVGVWLGGIWFHALIAAACGIMIWELVCMLDPARKQSQYALAAAAGLASFIAVYLPVGMALLVLLVPSLLGLARLQKGKKTYAVFAALILLAGYGMMGLRDDFGLVWIFWLLLVVIATDVAGYFAGRMIGGPKLWPRVSPKKTWSGAIAGWLSAAVVGGIFSTISGAGFGLVLISIIVSMASQMGDIAESAIKRRAGVKDSSALIPGHGGLLDRFDGMLGAALFILLVGLLVGFPPGAG